MDPAPSNLDDDKTVVHSNYTNNAKNVGSDDERGKSNVHRTKPASEPPTEIFCATATMLAPPPFGDKEGKSNAKANGWLATRRDIISGGDLGNQLGKKQGLATQNTG